MAITKQNLNNLRFNLQKLKQERDEPEKILEIYQELIESKGDGEIRLVPKFGDGKSQASLIGILPHDWFTGYQHETVWDKFEDFQDLQDQGIRKYVEGYFICSWEKALGIKSHDGTVSSIKYMSKDKIPDRFTSMWQTAEVDQLREKTVNQGGKYARKDMNNCLFTQKWNNQFDTDNLEGKVIFSTVDMAMANKWIAKELDTSRIYVDEGVAGKVSGEEIGDVEELFDTFTISRKNSNSTQYTAKRVSASEISESKINSKSQFLINTACMVQEAIEKSRNCKEMEVESYRSKYQVGFYKPDTQEVRKIRKTLSIISDIFENSPHFDKELKENDSHRAELIQMEKLYKWLGKVQDEGIAYIKHKGNLTKMISPEHQLDRLKDFTDDLILLRATWSPAWDDAMDFQPELVGEERSIREVDYSDYDANIIHVKYSQDKNSIEKKQLKAGKNEYLWELLDNTGWLKIGPKLLVNYFTGDFDYYTAVVGKNHGSYDKQVSVMLPRLQPHHIVYEAVKEFKELPENPNEESTRLTLNNSLQGYHCELLQAVWETRVEAKVVDSLFRSARSPNQSGMIYFIGELTQGIKQNWFGNFNIYTSTTLDEFVDTVIKRERMYQEAMNISQSHPIDLQDKEWTTNRGKNMKVNLNWAIDYHDWKDEITTNELKKFTGRSYSSCQSALKNSNKTQLIGNGIWKYT